MLLAKGWASNAWIGGETTKVKRPEHNNLWVRRHLIDVSGETKGSATAANIPADPKTLCFVRRNWTRLLKRLTMQYIALKWWPGYDFLFNEIIRPLLSTENWLSVEKPRPCVQICERCLCHIAGVIPKIEKAMLCRYCVKVRLLKILVTWIWSVK